MRLTNSQIYNDWIKHKRLSDLGVIKSDWSNLKHELEMPVWTCRCCRRKKLRFDQSCPFCGKKYLWLIK
jgi:hypothetical protein